MKTKLRYSFYFPVLFVVVALLAGVMTLNASPAYATDEPDSDIVEIDGDAAEPDYAGEEPLLSPESVELDQNIVLGANRAAPDYAVEGLSLSSGSVELGQGVVLAPEVTGPDAALATFNYVWRYGSGWDHWDSTMKRTGSWTSEASCEFFPDRPGVWDVWINHTNPDGTESQINRTVTVTQTWDVEEVVVAPASSKAGGKVALDIRFAEGSNTQGLTYNFAWRRLPGWGLWDSDMKGGGAPVASPHAEFSLPAPGSYELWFDVIDASGASKTLVARQSYTVAEPDYAVEGLSLSSGSVELGQGVVLSPEVTGPDAALATFNYVWRYGSGWDHWDSTMKRTGSWTSEASCEFFPDRPGVWDVWINHTNPDGTESQINRTVTVTRGWTFDGLTLTTPSTINRQELVSVSASASGNRADQLEYNYVWKRGDSWEYWDSTKKSTGGMTSQSSFDFYPTRGGTYSMWVDVHDPLSDETIISYLDVPIEVLRPWSFTENSCYLSSTVFKLGSTLSIQAQAQGDTDGVRYKVESRKAESSSSQVIQDFSSSCNCSWTPSEAGDYTLSITAQDATGDYETITQTISVWNLSAIRLDVIDGGVEGSLDQTVIITPQIGSGKGAGLTFTYRWMQSNWAKSGTIASNTASKSASWAPTEGYGTYTFIVDVKDRNGNTAQMSVSKWLQREDPYNGAYQYLSSRTNYLILADSTRCKLTIYRGSQYDWIPIRYWDCSPGKPSTPTPNGIYSVTGKGYSFGSGFTCYYYTQFYGDYLIHSGEYYQGTFIEMDNRMGMRISHGCVRLLLNRAKWVYDNIPLGTTVYCFGA